MSLLTKTPTLLAISGVIWACVAHRYGVSWLWALVATIVSLIVLKWSSFARVCRTLPRDLRLVFSFITEFSRLQKYAKNNYTVSDVFKSEVLPMKSNDVAFNFENKSWTFKQVEEYSNMVANYFLERGYKKGDVVCIFMDSCPEMVCLWLGLSKLGIIAALTNTKLRLEGLVHCIQSTRSKSIIFEGDLAQAVFQIQDNFGETFDLYCFGTLPDANSLQLKTLDLKMLLKDCSPLPPVVKDPPTILDELMYIFTSGTTGLPKACRITHKRYLGGSLIMTKLVGVLPDDKIYITMPMYHSAATALGVGPVLTRGCSAAIRKKFSASHFWEDCIRYDCTVVQYIGEIGRYLLAQPEKETDKQHRVRLAYGNGMRSEVWSHFQPRFNIKRIAEFYAATEGNVGLVTNPSSPIGSCGSVTISLPLPHPILIKVDEDTYKPLRDGNGLCIVAKTGEIGEFVAEINYGHQPYDGYTNHQQSEKKILHNVVKNGDRFYSSGDLMSMDNLGNCYFQDRIGDTFRWKGENVSTTEVETIISKLFHLQFIVVYGVNIPGTEGKAGMMAITDPDGTFDPSVLQNIQDHLPSYARPLFVRITQEPELTGTFKLKKGRLRQDGFDPRSISDPLFYLEPYSNMYKLLDNNIYSEICCGNIKY